VLVSVRRVVKDKETDREVTEARAAKAAPGTKATKKEAADANLGPVQEEVAEVTVEFPAILEHDPVSEVAAIISAATAGTGSLAGIMDRATFQRLLLRALNIPNVDDAIAEMDDEDIARQVERHENPPELELARQAQAAKLGGEEPDEDEDAPPAKKGAKKPTKRSRDKDVEEGIEESLSAVATALQEVARTALVEAEAVGHWVTINGNHVFIKGPAEPDTPAGQPETKTAGEAAARDFESSVKDSDVENAAVFTADGHKILEKAGTNDTIYFEKGEIQAMRDAYVTHNHPTGGSFSTSDVEMAIKGDVAEIRAVDQKYRYILTRGKEGWPDNHQVITAEFRDELGYVKEDLYDRAERGEIPYEDALPAAWDETWKRVASYHPGMNYRREPI
jgi:hypothetical protein